MTKKIDKKEEVLVHKIEEEKEARKKIPIEEQKKIHKRMFANLVIAAVIILYFIFIILGFNHIAREAFLIDLRVFSIGILIGAIVLFEKSYKKDDDILALYGIETLIVAIVTLVAIYVCILFETKFVMLISIASYAFAIYYIAKACVISKKMTKAYIESKNDIKEIVKKEKPEKAAETKKREGKVVNKKAEEKAKVNSKTKKASTSKEAGQKKKVGNTTKKRTTTKKENKTTKQPSEAKEKEEVTKKTKQTTKRKTATSTKKSASATKKQTTKKTVKKAEPKKEE